MMKSIGEKLSGELGLDQDGNVWTWEAFKGTKVVLYFYPKDNTPGCTVQACNLRDDYVYLQEMGFKIIGVSADEQKKHQKFIEKYNLPFPLISDVDKKLIQEFGVWGPKKFMGKEYEGIHRTTFIISQDGIIESVIKKVKTKEHSKQIIENLK